MPVEERALWLDPEGSPMLGIVTQPAPGAPATGTAVLIVVGGAQYRVGSHRQFVRLARALAASGHLALRFDLPSMGDSPGEPVAFEHGSRHIGAAVNAAAALQGVKRVVLWGLCDGASASLIYAASTADPRLAGLALLNPWVRSEASLARTQLRHYYRQRLREPDFWRKLLQGAVGRQALRDLMANLRGMRRPALPPLGFQDHMAAGWQAFRRPILLLLSERDLTAQEFVEYASTHPRWHQWDQHPGLTRHLLTSADHTCSSPASMLESETVLISWLKRLS
ncbi:MAG: hydrolase 1, exosortase A system-associated [Hydrogenophaga sp.]|nr:hydrolase 1, exosortase A system-associated [Hydrogenophaga sp.]